MASLHLNVVDIVLLQIEYWSRRMLTLISITEQLKTKQSRVVTGVMKARALRSDDAAVSKDNDGVSEQESVKLMIERWREVDLAITDHLNEAKDNVRFLENLRRVIEPLYVDSPHQICETMPSVMNSMKVRGIISSSIVFIKLPNFILHVFQTDDSHFVSSLRHGRAHD